MSSLGNYIKEQVDKKLREDKINFLCSLPITIYNKLMYECLEENHCTGAIYENVHYDEHILYTVYWYFYPDGDPWF